MLEIIFMDFTHWIGTLILLCAPIAVLCDGIRDVVKEWKSR